MRAVLWVGSVVVALAAVVGASRLWAETKEKKSAPRTRIALVNLTYVIKNYDKFKQFQGEIMEFVDSFQGRDVELRARLMKLVPPLPGEDRDEKSKKKTSEEKPKMTQREIEDKQTELKIKIGKKSDEAMKIMYKDVYEAARSYATAQDLDLVLQYNDPITQEDYPSAESITRRFNTGALKPLYSKEGMDISRDLVTLLNQKMHKK